MSEIEVLDTDYLYDTLGVSKDAPLSHINEVYRNFMRLCHPDKHSTKESQELGISYNEKVTLFNKIQDAYKKILSIKKETNAPDYSVNYEIESDYYQSSGLLENIRTKKQMHYELLGHISNDLHTVTKTNKTELLLFNKAFEEKHKNNTEGLLIDEVSEKYNAFNSKDREDEHNYIKINRSRPDVNVVFEETIENYIVHDEIILRENTGILFSRQSAPKNNIQCTELQASNNNFTNYDLQYTDLLEAYENNYESLQKTFERQGLVRENECPLEKSVEEHVINRTNNDGIKIELTEEERLKAIAFFKSGIKESRESRESREPKR